MLPSPFGLGITTTVEVGAGVPAGGAVAPADDWVTGLEVVAEGGGAGWPDTVTVAGCGGADGWPHPANGDTSTSPASTIQLTGLAFAKVNRPLQEFTPGEVNKPAPGQPSKSGPDCQLCAANPSAAARQITFTY